MTGVCPMIATKLGKVKGRALQKQSHGKQVYNYTNLPFAKPPVGELRFEPPCKPEPWTGLRDGTKNPPSPPQDLQMEKMFENYFLVNTELNVDSENMDEDCLYLSVFTTNPSKTANLPVLFWIYGGGFTTGSQSAHNAHLLSALNDVVVVIPNYRVGVFGFFSIGKDASYSGNMGLLDQVMALEWTREHIENFGGNPNNVTIFGESAGSMSVCYHMLSPLSRGLFHRAIAHSGTATFQGALKEDNDFAASALLEELGIKEKNPVDAMAKLKSLSLDDIVKGQEEIIKKMEYFAPCIDGKFLSDSPDKLLSEGKVASVPLILGCNNTETSGILALHQVGFADGFSEETCTTTIKQSFDYVQKIKLPDSAYDLIKKKYSEGISNDDKYKWSKVYGKVIADVQFTFLVIETAKYHAKFNHPTYLYNMTQSLRCYHDLEYGQQKMMKVPFCECDHGDDIYFTFGAPLDEGRISLNVKFTEEEKQLSKEWMKYLTNFATTGSPNKGTPVLTKWPSFSVKEQRYLSVQHPCSAKKDLATDRLQFWEEVIEIMQEKS